MELLGFIIELIGFICELIDDKFSRKDERKISRSHPVHQ